MSRKHQAPQREVLPDPKYNDILITKVINTLMYDGKKSTAESIFYQALDLVEKKMNEEGIKVFKKRRPNLRLSLDVLSVVVFVPAFTQLLLKNQTLLFVKFVKLN